MKMYMVLNAARNEGVLFDNEADAVHAATNEKNPGFYSTLASDFNDCYGDEKLFVEEVEIPGVFIKQS